MRVQIKLGARAQNFNQMTRWVNTKEEHCSKIMTTVADYCLAQRCKVFGTAGSPFATEQDYIDALKAHHAVTVVRAFFLVLAANSSG